jgi:ubiquinone/menaquinone biosynthesis C-methylase UbiE
VALLKFIAGQLRKPSGFIGRRLVAKMLNAGNRPMNRLTLTSLGLTRDDRVIEVGFGGGDLIRRMASVVTHGCIVGVDFSPEMVEVCTKRFAPLVRAERIELRCASADHLPYDSGHFTKACTVNTLYFWPDPVGPLNELRRVLRPGGRLVLCFNPRATLQKVAYTEYGFRLYESAEVQRLLETVGFANVQMVSGSSRFGGFFCAVGTRET